MVHKRSGGQVKGHYRNGSTWVSEHFRSGTTVEVSREERIAMALLSIEKKKEWETEKATRHAEYEERERQRAIKKSDYEKRQNQRTVKQTEWKNRQRWTERDSENTAVVIIAVAEAIYDISKWCINRFKNSKKQAELKKQQAIRQAEYEVHQKQLELEKENELMNKIKNTSPAFRRGDDINIKTIIVLSAPGQKEEKAGRPAAGQTGKTLQEAIEFWHNALPNEFPSKNLDDYTIVNAVEDVHYKAKTGRTEGTDTEVCDTDNMTRINAIIADAQYVVALGNKAQLAVSVSIFKRKTYSGIHPSMNALNKQYSSQKRTPNERSSDRIKQWANDILVSIET